MNNACFAVLSSFGRFDAAFGLPRCLFDLIGRPVHVPGPRRPWILNPRDRRPSPELNLVVPELNLVVPELNLVVLFFFRMNFAGYA